MFSQRTQNEFLGKDFLWLWAGLAFQAGYVNAAGFLACARFVSHMTGFGTQVGMAASGWDFALALEMISAPASFVLGTMVSALVVDRPMLAGRKPKYLLVMAMIVVIYIFVTVGGLLGWFGGFGEPLVYFRDFALMGILCFVCGLQNACFASLTRGQIRTTHLTGILTDIGVTWVKLFCLSKSRDKVVLQRVNSVRILIFCCFSMGSAMSAVVVMRAGYRGFALLIATSATLLTVALIQTRRQRQRRAHLLTRIEAHAAEAERPASPSARKAGSRP